MRSARPMSCFAGNPKDHLSGVELPAGDRCGRMIAQALGCFVFINFSAESVLQRSWDAGGMIGRDVDAQAAIVADACLVEVALVLENKALAVLAAAERSKNWRGKRGSAVIREQEREVISHSRE